MDVDRHTQHNLEASYVVPIYITLYDTYIYHKSLPTKRIKGQTLF